MFFHPQEYSFEEQHRTHVLILNNVVLTITLDQSHLTGLHDGFSFNATCEFLSGLALLTSRLFIEVLSPSVRTSLSVFMALGVDSNSEYSSGSGVLLSDSRETSLADSWVDSPPQQGGGDRGCRRRSSGEVSFKELDWEQAGRQQQQQEEEEERAGTEVEPRPQPSQKRSEAAPQEWWGASGEE